MELAARITDAFRISGRGIVLTVEFASEAVKLRVGERIELKSPGGEITAAEIRAISHLKLLKPGGSKWGITLSPPVHNQEFEQGTEIWLPPRFDGKCQV